MKRTSTPGAFHNYPDRGLVGAASAPSLCATMKRTVALLAAGLPFLALAQSPITVTTGPGYSQQTWYQLSTDAVTGAPLAEWDLAFEINGGFTASILANTQKGLAVYQAPYAVAEWDVADTNGLAVSWTALHNSDTDWSTGALNRDANLDLFNLGWGIYDMVTHVVGGDSIYVVHLSSGAWKKLRIDALTGGTYHFTYADLDGTNEQMHALDKNDYMGKNFAYWSLEADAAIDREPASADWDLLFGKYMTDIGVWYGVTGALNNKGVRVVEVTGTPSTEAQMDWNGFHDDINTIGYDWKTFNNGTFQYEIADSLTYFVQDGPGNIWKLVFSGFGGSSTGDISFTKELVSAVGMAEADAPSAFVVYPNPVSGGAAQIVTDATAQDAYVAILDLGGKLMRQQRLGALTGLGVSTIDVNGLAAGVYAVRLHADGAVRMGKLVIE